MLVDLFTFLTAALVMLLLFLYWFPEGRFLNRVQRILYFSLIPFFSVTINIPTSPFLEITGLLLATEVKEELVAVPRAAGVLVAARGGLAREADGEHRDGLVGVAGARALGAAAGEGEERDEGQRGRATHGG